MGHRFHRVSTGSVKNLHTLLVSVYFSGRWDIGDIKARNGQKFEFFWTFGPPCRNPLAKVDGSMPECAQVCALHTRSYLVTLKENRNDRQLSCYRRKPQNWYYVTHFLAHSVDPRERWVHTYATVDRGEIKLFSVPAYTPLFLIVYEIYGRKITKC